MLFKKKDNNDYYSAGVEKYNAGEYLLAIEYFQAELENHPDNNVAQSYLEKAEKEIQQQRLNHNSKFQRNQGSMPFQKQRPSSQKNRKKQVSQNPPLINNTGKIKRAKPISPDVIMWIMDGFLLLFMFYLIIHFRDNLKYPYGLYFFGYAVCVFIVSVIVSAIFNDDVFEDGVLIALLASPLVVWFLMKCIGAHPVALAIVFFVLTGLCCFVAYRNQDVLARKFLLTSGSFCAMWALFFIVPVVWKPIAEHQITKAEERLNTSKMQIHQHADKLRARRQTQTREAGFMGLMIGDNYNDVLSKCQETGSILAVSPYTPSYYEEKVKGTEFDSVLKIKAFWDNNEVDAKVYFLNYKAGAIKFNIDASNTIVSIYEKKYGEPEMNVNWSRIEPWSIPHWSEGNRRFPYYYSLYISWLQSKRATLDTAYFSWSFKNVMISLNKNRNLHNYWTVEYVASWVLDTVRVRHERDSLMKVQEHLVEELRRLEENQARRQAAMEEEKRRDESHRKAVENI